MKKFFEEWGCLSLILAAAAFYVFASSDSQSKIQKQPNPAPPIYVQPQPTFGGYACTDDCSGHEAGYEWAQEQGISDPDDCGGDSISFEEGCRSYAEEQEEEDAEESLDF
ncbi:MAG: hypothetical protein ACK440_03970 [Sphingomonadaceae bacterium]|jgi:hypothetical protein